MAKVREATTNGAVITTISRSFVTHAGGAPTAGNLLIAALGLTAQQASMTGPTDWTLIEQVTFGAGNMFGAWHYKISDGTEDTIAYSWGASASGTIVIMEFDDDVTTLDDSADDESDISTAVTTFDTGAATATVATGLALVMFNADDGRNVDAGRAYSDSFLEEIAAFNAAAGRGAVFIAAKAISGTGSYSCQYTTSDTGDEGYGSVALFVTPAGGSVPRSNLLLMGVGA